ncbi:MAG: alpha/beta hydrolase [Bacteroidota bacterium]
MKKSLNMVLTILGILIVGLVIGWILGPKAPTPILNTSLPELTKDLKKLEEEINSSEKAQAQLKPDNEARIIWADGYEHQKSPVSVVYLHGFSASQGEGDPVHIEFAKRYGCNLFLSRLQSHGLETEEPLLDLTPENLMESAKFAIAVGERLGDETILMSTSTGGTLALYLASEHPDLAGLICYAPNVDVKDPSSELLVGPWGLQLARLVMGGKYRMWESSEEEQNYWTTKYRLESLIALKALVNATMTEEVFNKVTNPIFLAYYYKSETEQDDVVSIPRMLEMYDQIGTPESMKRKVELPDVGTHPLASKYTSQDIESVLEATYSFAEEVLGLIPIPILATDSLTNELTKD